MGRGTLQRLLIRLLLAACAAGPLVVGVLPVVPALLLLAPLAALALYAFTRTGAPAWTKKIAAVGLSITFAVTAFDLLARPLLLYVFEDRPKLLFARRLPALPEVYRFAPNVNFRARTYGDLAAVAGRRDWREYREISFITDAYGFRNDTTSQDAARPFDLVVLGDSFGVGDGTSQEQTWASVLAREHNLAAYNLSMDGASPWQEYVNFLLEGERLRLRPGTLVAWVFFTGNDLDDLYLPAYERAQLP